MNNKITKFEDLQCWQKSRILNKMVFEICDNNKLKRDFTMQDQLKRASLSIMNNIAEGFGRFSHKDFVRFLNISSSSNMEVRSMLYVLLDRQYIFEEQFQSIYNLCVEQCNLTLGLIRYLNTKIEKYGS